MRHGSSDSQTACGPSQTHTARHTGCLFASEVFRVPFNQQRHIVRKAKIDSSLRTNRHQEKRRLDECLARRRTQAMMSVQPTRLASLTVFWVLLVRTPSIPDVLDRVSYVAEKPTTRPRRYLVVSIRTR